MVQRNTERKVRVGKKKKKKCSRFPLLYHNAKKIAFANYHSLKAIRVLEGTVGMSRSNRESARTEFFQP